MKKNIILVFLSIIVGVFLSLFMFKQYDKNTNYVFASSNALKYFFIGLGTYSSYDNMINNTNQLDEFIYTKENDLYHVFGCITKNKENLDKIEGYFKDKGYITYIREFNLSNRSLNTEVTSTDLLLDNIEKIDSIKELCKQTLKTYKEG